MIEITNWPVFILVSLAWAAIWGFLVWKLTLTEETDTQKNTENQK